MARVQVRGRGHPGEGCEVTRAEKLRGFNRCRVSQRQGLRKRRGLRPHPGLWLRQDLL